MAKFKNCFSSTLGEGDEIKSFLATNNGGLLTSTTVGLCEALDVNVKQISDAAGNTLAINPDGSLNVQTGAAKPLTWAASQPVVGATEAVIATKLTSQCKIYVRNEGSQPIYVGPTGVTTATGYKIGCGEVECFEGDADLFAIAAASTTAGDLHVFQIAA